MLYQKYRPATFAEMIGSEAQVEALARLLEDPERRPHCFLFSGPAGCGKTTAARIAAASLGAAGLAGIREVNSANNRGIDSAREIIDQMRYQPLEGEATVWIIDEAHQTSKDFQNAMLKPTEDPESHVYFFLCTTDPQKIIPALRSRCTEVKFQPLTSEQLAFLVRKVARAEGVKLEKADAEAIGEKADGSPRRALVLLEKALGVEDPEKRKRVIREGALDEGDAEVIDVCRLLLRGKEAWPELTKKLKALYAREGLEAESIRYAVLGYMNAVLLGGKANVAAALALEYFSEPTYATGKPGITLAAFQTLFSR